MALLLEHAPQVAHRVEHHLQQLVIAGLQAPLLKALCHGVELRLVHGQFARFLHEPVPGAGRRRLRAQFGAEVFAQRIAQHILQRAGDPLGLFLDPAPGGLAQVDPVGRPVACALEALAIHEGLQVMDRVTVELLPVGADPAGDAAQDMAGQMRNLDPGQDEEARVICQEMEMLPAHRRRPADEPVARSHVPRSGTPCQAGHWPLPRIHHVLELFAHRLGVAQVMIALDQPVEQRLVGRATHLPDLQRQKLSQRRRDRALVQQPVRRRPLAMGERIRRRMPFGRQFDMPAPMQRQHQTPADHVAQRPVGLPPIPRFAQPGGELPSAGAGMLRDEPPNRFNLIRGNRTTAIDQNGGTHADEDSKAFAGTHALFTPFFFRPVPTPRQGPP